MRKLAAVGFTQLAEVGFGIDSAHSHERFDPIGLVEMGQLADKGELQVVDVREAAEQTEMAAGALPVPYRLLAEADLSKLDPERPTAVVCHTGVRAPLARLAAGAPRLQARAPRARRGHERLGHARGGRRRRGRGSRDEGRGARRRARRPRRRRSRASGWPRARRAGPASRARRWPRSAPRRARASRATAATCPAHGSALTTSTRRIGPSAGCTRSRLAAWSTPPMLPPSAAGAALNGYSTTPRSHSTRRLLENGYESGCIRPPSTMASPPSCSTIAWQCCAAPCGPLRSARAKTRRGVPSTRRERVEVVHHQIDADAAGARRVDHPVVPGRWRREPLGARRERPAELARRDDPPQLDVLGPEAQHEADDEQLAGALGRRDDRLGVLERERDRLLQQHVLARGECPLGGLAVLRGRQADVDDVDVVARERRVEVVGRLRSAQGGDARGALERARRDGDDPRPPGLRRPCARVRLAHEAAADDRDVDHPRPSAFRCAQARAIEAWTSASGGHGSPWNSISTESGPR